MLHSRSTTLSRPVELVLWALIPALILTNVAWVLAHGDTRVLLTILGVLIFFTISAVHLWSSQGPARALIFMVIILGITWCVEAIGVATGLPFGTYSYSSQLGVSLLGVPLLIPMAWFMMAYPCWLVGRSTTTNPIGRVTISVVLLVAWDIFLEPQMVGEGYWQWNSTATIPASNYVGWLVTALVLMICLHSLRTAPTASYQPQLAATLAWVYVSNVLAGAVFFGRPLTALLGALVMGIPVLLWLRRARPFSRVEPSSTAQTQAPVAQDRPVKHSDRA